MEAYLWIGGLGLLAIVGGGLFFAIQRHDFVAGLVKSFVTMAINALLPVVLKRMPPDEEEAWNKFQRSNPDKREIARWRKEYQKRRKAVKQ